MIKKMLFILALILQANISWSQDTIVNSKKTFTEEEVSSGVIGDIPIIPGCENVKKDQRLACFREKMWEHIKENFKYPKEARKKKIQGRISVLFIINTEGEIENIETKGPEGCELLEEEAARIISLLPKMKPGMENGKPVRVKYSQPITFKLL